jgi:hypothetical protein
MNSKVLILASVFGLIVNCPFQLLMRTRRITNRIASDLRARVFAGRPAPIQESEAIS